MDQLVGSRIRRLSGRISRVLPAMDTELLVCAVVFMRAWVSTKEEEVATGEISVAAVGSGVATLAVSLGVVGLLRPGVELKTGVSVDATVRQVRLPMVDGVDRRRQLWDRGSSTTLMLFWGRSSRWLRQLRRHRWWRKLQLSFPRRCRWRISSKG